MDLLYYISPTKIRSDLGPMPGSGIVIHSECELRELYAQQMRRCLADVESAQSLNDISTLLLVTQPRIIVIEASLVFPLAGQRMLRRLWEAHPQIALVTVGDSSHNTLPPGAAAGIRAHILSTTTRIGAISEMVREVLK